MVRKQKEAVIFVVNTGQTSTEILEHETESFLEKSKAVIKQILERKIFIRKDDMVNIICFGANETKNEENMINIYQFESELIFPTWAMVQKMMDFEPSDKSTSWVEGLHVALNFVQNTDLGDIENVKILVLNNFKEDPEVIGQFNAQVVAQEIIEASVDIMFIGYGYDEEDVDNLSKSHKLALRVCKRVTEKSNFCCCEDSIDDCLWETRFYKNPPTKPTPWKCILKLGKISIPTETYVKITQPPPFPSWKLTTRNDSVGFPPESEVTDVKRESELVDRHRNVTDKEDAIRGYKYGGKFIPFSEEDSKRAKFKGTVKSFIIRGLVKQDEVPMENWFGKGCHVIVPENSIKAKEKFYALLLSMQKSNLVGIVRRVYQANNVPKMGILFPRLVQGEIACFVLVGLPFAEERRILNPTEEINLPSEENQKDVEDFIDSMTLSEDDGRFKPGSFSDPCKQTKWDFLSHRALNRDPLPPMDKVLKDLISSPEELLVKSEPFLKRISEWVKPKESLLRKEEIKENEESVKNEEVEDAAKTEDELIKAAEEAEKQNKCKDNIFKELEDDPMIPQDEDFIDDM